MYIQRAYSGKKCIFLPSERVLLINETINAFKKQMLFFSKGLNPISEVIHILCVIPLIYWLCWGLTTRQPLWVILYHLPQKGRKEIEETVEEMKESNREERETGMKVKKQ